MLSVNTYDDASRLTQLAEDVAGTTYDQTLGFSYNPAGQIVQNTRSNDNYAWTGHYNVNRTYTANGLNQYTASGSVTPTYDSKGNLTSAGSTTYSYSAENLLTSASGGITLAYDPAMRLYQTAGGTPGTTRFQYDGSDLIAEYNGSNALQRRFVLGPGTDEPLVWYEGSGTTDRRFLHADERGSVVAVTNSSGTVLSVNTYDEYGIPRSSNTGRFQYTGQTWLPELGLYYYKARIYSPTLGRFLQTDPVGYGDGLNMYAYVRADPTNSRDPTGLQGCPSGSHWENDPGSRLGRCVRNADATGAGTPGQGGAGNGGNSGGGNTSGKAAAPGSGNPLDLNGDGKVEDWEIDAIVVTARKNGNLAGVTIDFHLTFPLEQLWLVDRSSGVIVHVPTKAKKSLNACGNEVAENVLSPDPNNPPPGNPTDIVHNHMVDMYEWPEWGDYQSAAARNVYGIMPNSVWVLRRGAPAGSAPVTLDGTPPTRPSPNAGVKGKC